MTTCKIKEKLQSTLKPLNCDLKRMSHCTFYNYSSIYVFILFFSTKRNNRQIKSSFSNHVQLCTYSVTIALQACNHKRLGWMLTKLFDQNSTVYKLPKTHIKKNTQNQLKPWTLKWFSKNNEGKKKRSNQTAVIHHMTTSYYGHGSRSRDWFRY